MSESYEDAISPFMTPSGFRDGRVFMGLTAEELAELMGVTENTIYRKETGDTVIRSSDALAMRMLILINKHSPLKEATGKTSKQNQPGRRAGR